MSHLLKAMENPFWHINCNFLMFYLHVRLQETKIFCAIPKLYVSILIKDGFKFIHCMQAEDTRIRQRRKRLYWLNNKRCRHLPKIQPLSYNHTLNRQTVSFAIGSCVNLIEADISMHNLELNALYEFLDSRSMWKWYVNDTFFIFEKTKLCIYFWKTGSSTSK